MAQGHYCTVRNNLLRASDAIFDLLESGKTLTQEQKNIDFLTLCMYGETKSAIEILTKGELPDVNYTFTDKDGNSNTPITITLSSRNSDRYQLLGELVRRGADINMPDLDRNTPLHIALGNGGRDLHDLHGRCTPDDIVALIGLGANPNARDLQGRTPLHLVALRGDVEYSVDGVKTHSFSEVAELLVSRDADINARDELGYTPLGYCSSFHDKDQKHTISTNTGPGGAWQKRVIDNDEYTLMCCTKYDHMILKLLELGADHHAKVKDSHGKTHLHLLVARYNAFHPESIHPNIIKFLLKHGADIYALDDDGRMPYQFARGFEAIAPLIAHDIKLVERMDLEQIQPWSSSRFCLYKALLDAHHITPGSPEDKGISTMFAEVFKDINRDILRQFYKKIQHYNSELDRPEPVDYSQHFLPDPRIAACLQGLSWLTLKDADELDSSNPLGTLDLPKPHDGPHVVEVIGAASET